MFDKKIYTERRQELKKQIESGIILLLGNDDSPMDYAGNNYPFIQNSNFLYYVGCNVPGLAVIIDIDEDEEVLFGDDITVDDQIWMGTQPLVKERGEQSGFIATSDLSHLEYRIKKSISQRRRIHYLPVSRADSLIKIERLKDIPHSEVNKRASTELIKAVVKQRSVKADFEVEEIEKALGISHEMYTLLLNEINPGISEQILTGKIESIIRAYGSNITFPTILTTNGKTLHNHHHGNVLKNNHLLLVDSGAKSPENYSSDISRTYPVNGKFSPRQKSIYEIVLKSQISAINEIRPGIAFRDIHLKTAEVIVEGLKNVGIMKGNVGEAVKEGAHALFFPHGLGHMLGIEAHDMEGIGENYVGYDENIKRSSQFGLANLRMARELQPGFVVTVEPGIYFIPPLIDLWKSQNKLSDFINYSEVEKYKDFEGIRIEDDILVTDSGSRVLGRPIPKDVDEIERVMKR